MMEIAAQLRCLLEGLTGVRDAILCSRDGNPMESLSAAMNVAEAAVLTASIANELSRVGEMLALGKLAVARAPQPAPAMAADSRRASSDLDGRAGSWSAPRFLSEKHDPKPVTRLQAQPPTRPERATVSHEPVFAGQLELFALPDLLEFLRAGARTGKLRVEGPAGSGLVRIRRGRITAASSPNIGTLGDYLVRHKVINGEQLRSLLQEQRQDPHGKSLGRLSIDRGVATAADVRRALVAQVQDAIRELKDWSSGQFAFEPEQAPEPSLSDIELELDPQAVLLAIYTEDDEARRDASG